jgi:hypothetical protein
MDGPTGQTSDTDDMNNIPVEDLPIGQDNIAIVTPSEQAAKRQTRIRESSKSPLRKTQ